MMVCNADDERMQHMFKNHEGKVRSGWKIFFVCGVFFVLVLLMGVVFSLLAAARALQTDGEFMPSYNEQFGQWLWLMMIIQSILMAAVVVVAWKGISRRRLTDMGFGRVRGKELLAGLLLGTVSMTLAFAVIVLSGSGYVESWTPRLTADTGLYLLLFVAVGLAEEMMTRGYFMSVLRQTKSVPVIVIVSSVLFSLMHVFNASFSLIPFVNIVLVGLLLAYMFLKSGSIWMPIGFHITWNYFQGSVFGFSVSGLEVQGLITTQYAQENIINGGAFGPEGGVLATALLLLGFLFVRWYYRKRRLNFLLMDQPAAPDAPVVP
jgi:hypothetical protein